MPKLSIIVPIHDMKNGAFFLWRLINSLVNQTFQDYEIIITKEGKMAENTNAGIKRARGELIKILYLDDYLSSPKALEDMVNAFTEDDVWMVCGTNNNPEPKWTDDIETGNNKLGSPSALMMRRSHALYFDEQMSWMLDCDLYKRMEMLWGQPKILSGDHVTIGEGDHQVTHTMSQEEKNAEERLIKSKYEAR